MLFWTFVAVLIVGIICEVLYDNVVSVDDWVYNVGFSLIVISTIAITIYLGVLSCSYFGIDGQIAENTDRHESLTYQYENDLYDNDNDLGKKELMNEIRDWNEDLAWYRENQDDFWIGIFISNIFDQLDFIEYSSFHT